MFAFTEEEVRERCSGGNEKKMEEAKENAPARVRLDEASGFYRAKKAKLRADGLAVAAGGDGALRLCAAQAAFSIVRTLRPELKGQRTSSQASMEKLLPGTLDPKDDPTWDAVRRVLERFDVSLHFVRNVSPRLLINFESGVYLLRLEYFFKDEPEPGYHFTVYDAASGAILDNMMDVEAIVIDDSDRKAAVGKKANVKAMRPFHAAFPAADKITIAQVYLCERVPPRPLSYVPNPRPVLRCPV
jgi:hypothetical protein